MRHTYVCEIIKNLFKKLKREKEILLHLKRNDISTQLIICLKLRGKNEIDKKMIVITF